MASDKSFVDFVVEQMAGAGPITSRSMFGEYALFRDAKVFALICDNRLFMKPTAGGREFIQNVVESPPYPGAKSSFLIGEQLEDRSWLCELVSITVQELPAPKPKKKRKK